MRGCSHDVKDPIGAAAGMLDLLEDGALGDLEPKQRHAVVRPPGAVARALRLIDDLLELARAEAGEIDIGLESVELREAVHELVEEYRRRGQRPGDRGTVPRGDPGHREPLRRIRQILGNLLSNAVTYTERGRITVRVGGREEGTPRAGCWLAVDVSDTSPGIPKDKQNLLFQEFERIEPGAGRGTGLGLAISQPGHRPRAPRRHHRARRARPGLHLHALAASGPAAAGGAPCGYGRLILIVATTLLPAGPDKFA